MASGNAPLGELEEKAARQRQRLSEDVARLRQDVHAELDVRTRIADGIHHKPGPFYGTAAGVALFIGYVFARILKA